MDTVALVVVNDGCTSTAYDGIEQCFADAGCTTDPNFAAAIATNLMLLRTSACRGFDADDVPPTEEPTADPTSLPSLPLPPGITRSPASPATPAATFAPTAPTPAPIDMYKTYVDFSDKARYPWDYSSNGTDWPKRYPDCGGSAQSPVNIDVRATPPVMSELPLKAFYMIAPENTLRVSNNGRTLSVDGTGFAGSALVLGDERYELMQIVAHAGSETTVNGQRSALELHFVHRHAVDHSLLVLAVLFDLKGNDNTKLKLWDNKSLKAVGGTAPIAYKLDPVDLLPPQWRAANTHTDDYFFYVGSLTTPPCTEGVKWVVLQLRSFLSRDQFLAFPLAGNFRPAQPLNGRVVARTAPFPTLAPTRHPLDAYATQAEALEAAAKLNCTGAHQMAGLWYAGAAHGGCTIAPSAAPKSVYAPRALGKPTSANAVWLMGGIVLIVALGVGGGIAWLHRATLIQMRDAHLLKQAGGAAPLHGEL